MSIRYRTGLWALCATNVTFDIEDFDMNRIVGAPGGPGARALRPRAGRGPHGEPRAGDGWACPHRLLQAFFIDTNQSFLHDWPGVENSCVHIPIFRVPTP